ncbi:hypothetical protein ACR0ST_01990 [Aliidiomarina sp. Khilg15.8]
MSTNNASMDTGIDDAKLKSLTQWVADAALGGQDRLSTVPAALGGDMDLRVVFITLADGEGHYEVASGLGMGVQGAATVAYKRVQQKWNHPTVQVKVDIMCEVIAADPARVRANERLLLDRTLAGIVIDKLENAWLPEESTRHDLVERNGRINYDQVRRVLGERITNLYSDKVWVFTARSRYADASQNTLMFRNHPFRPTISVDKARQVALEGAASLARHTPASGRMNYEYDAATDTVSDDYNIIRHAGSLWSMLEIYKEHPTVELRQAIANSTKYMKTQIQTFAPQYPDMQILRCEGMAKLGANGLGLVALASAYRHGFDDTLLPTMQAMGRWILGTQTSQGELPMHAIILEPMRLLAFKCEYYPGEAILGLVNLYRVDRDYRWLEAADRAARWLIEVRDGGKDYKELDRDHWLLYGLNALHRELPRPMFPAHARKLMKRILHEQHQGATIADWNGGWKTPPLSTSAGCMCEGLSAGYELLRDFDADEDELLTMRKAIEAGLANQLQYRFTPETSVYLRNPKRAHGGFHCSFTRWEVRIDYTQHSLTSFLNYWRLFKQ